MSNSLTINTSPGTYSFNADQSDIGQAGVQSLAKKVTVVSNIPSDQDSQGVKKDEMGFKVMRF